MNILFRNCVVLIFAAFVFQGCATAPVRTTAEELIADADKLYSEGKYERAIEQWKKVREKYPPPEVSAKVELAIADTYFLNKEFIESAVEYEGFRKLHPRHQRAGYALFRQALSNYKQIKGVDTDQVPLNNSLQLFESYLAQYPAGEFKAEVIEKINECKDKQVQYELYVGKFYLRTGKVTSAIGRFEYALKMYPEKIRRAEILFYLGKAYREADQKNKALETERSLVKEYPESEYAKKTGLVSEKGL